MSRQRTLDVTYNASKTGSAFHQSPALVRGIMGPLGCVAPDTKIVTAEGLVRICDIDRPVRVLSWCEKSSQFVFSPTGGAFPKGRDYLYRVETQAGVFEAAPHHQMLCADGSYQRVDTLCQGQSVFLCSSDLTQTNSEAFQLLLRQDVHHYSQKALDYLGDYAVLARQYGQRLLRALGSDQVFAPSPSDVPQFCQSFGQTGGLQGREQSHSRQGLLCDHQPSLDFSHHGADRFLAGAGLSSSSLFGRTLAKAQQFLQFPLSFLRRLKAQLFSACSGSSNIPPYSFGTIISIKKKVVKQDYWDMQVADTNNYVTEDGCVHHNSGKSVACVMEIFRLAQLQERGPDGYRHSRWLVVRNTLPQLKTTTMNTWFDWIPHDTDDQKMFGPRTYTPPFYHHVGFNDVKMEVIFMALDSEADEERLKSLELTGVYFNEVKYIPFGLVAAAIPRTGRYPGPKLGGCTRRAVIMDTNAPDEDHWFYTMAEEDGWVPEGKTREEVAPQHRWEFFKQPSGLSEDADNLEWLNQTGESLTWPLEKRRERGREYYTSMMSGQSKEWVNVNVHGNYGVENTGTAVFRNEWRDDYHYVDAEYVLPKEAEIKIGIDCSGRNPSAVFLHPGAEQMVHAFDELVAEGIGAEQFSKELRDFCDKHYKGHDIVLWGDPAGGWGSQTNEKTYNDCLRDQGFVIYPASQGLRIAPRIESTKSILQEKRGGLRVYRKCKLLRKAFNGAYIYKSFRVNGIDQATHEPDKRKSGRHADVMDAFMYGNIGIGGVRRMRKRPPMQLAVAQQEWSPLD